MSTAPAPRPRRGRLIGLFALAWLALIGLGLAWLLQHGVAGWGELPVHVVINGREVLSGIDFGALGVGHVLATAFGVLFALLVLVSVLSLGLLLGLGVPLLVLAIVLFALALPAALLLLPLWWLLRWLLRGPTAPR